MKIDEQHVYKDKHFPGTPPSSDANEYPEVCGIDPEAFVLTADAQDSEKRSIALEQLERYIKTQKEKFLGYQVNQNLSYGETLSKYLDTHINNIGDPFQSGNFTVNSKFAERAVLDYFASLWHAKWPHKDSDGESYWGYVLSMGSSEGNIYAMWNARDYLAGRYLLLDREEGERTYRRHSRYRYRHFDAYTPEHSPNAYSPVIFFSDNTHYSIIKNTRILNIPTFAEVAAKNGYRCPLIPDTADYPPDFSYENNLDKKTGWPHYLPSNSDGSVYIPALVRLADFFSEKGYPILFSFNYGTTFKGALDNVKEAVASVVPVLKRNNMYERTIIYDEEKGLKDTRTGFWVHVDGALGAGYAPFLRMDKAFKKELPEFDFAIPEVHSIIMSGHKWLGAPWPCGIFMSKVKYQLKPVSNPLYIGSPDSTFSGSRNGMSSLLLWDFISRHSADELTQKVKKALKLADDFMKRFAAEVTPLHCDIDLWLEQSPRALTIRFRRPNPKIVFDFSLSNETLYADGEWRDYSHIFIMDHVTEKQLDALIYALKAKNAFRQAEDSAVMGAAENSAAFDGFGLGFR